MTRAERLELVRDWTLLERINVAYALDRVFRAAGVRTAIAGQASAR